LSVEPGPYLIDDTPVVLGPDASASPRPFTDDFYEALDRDFDGFAGHVLFSQYRFTEAWPSWEMHPKGDEIVCLIEGDVDFILRTEEGDRVMRLDRPGSYVVVPRGTWHTAQPRRPTVMTFLTPGEGTQHADEPPIA
jgi:mannose-6-phosphate isomerase-like protein (cupin superfamily)